MSLRQNPQWDRSLSHRSLQMRKSEAGVQSVNRFHDDQQPDSVTVRPRHDFVFVFSFRSDDTVASQTTSVFASWSEGDEGVQMVWLSVCVCDDIITPQASSVSQPSRLHSAPLSSLRGFHVDRPLTRLQLNELSAGKLFTWTTIKCHGRLALPALWSR